MVEKGKVVLRNQMLWDDYGYVRKNLLRTFETYYQVSNGLEELVVIIFLPL